MKTPALRLIIAALAVAVIIALVVFSRSSAPPPPAAAGTGQPATGSTAKPAVAPASASVVSTSVHRPSLPLPEPAAPVGVAKVTLDGREITPPNHVAHFERIKVAPLQDIPIEVAWPADRTSTEVLAHAIQGGTIDRAGNSRRLPLTAGVPVKFTFTAGHEAGLYEILLRRGTQEEVLEFWVPTSHPENDPPSLN